MPAGKRYGIRLWKTFNLHFLTKKLPEPELDLGLNEVFSAGWGTNAVQV